MIFYYTDHTDDFASSLVEGIYYDSHTRHLGVELGGTVYVYAWVDSQTYYDFVEAGSKGRFYNEFRKVPGTRAAYTCDADDVARRETYINPAVRNVSPEEVTAAIRRVGAVGTPKALVDKTDSNVTNVTNLTTLTAPKPSRKNYRVDFEIDDTLRHYSVEADSVDGAVAKTLEVAEMLDLTFIVKGVYVSFE